MDLRKSAKLYHDRLIVFTPFEMVSFHIKAMQNEIICSNIKFTNSLSVKTSGINRKMAAIMIYKQPWFR